MYTVQDALAEFQQAWHAGMAPSTELYLSLVDPADRDATECAIGNWLGFEAPSVEPHPARRAELLADPLIQRLAGLE